MQQELLKMALEFGADFAGWASLNKGELQSYSLLEASEAEVYRSALVIAKRHKATALKGLTNVPTPAYDRDYQRLNKELFAIIQALARRLKENDIRCRGIEPTETLDSRSQRGLISHKALAERAGIGKRGKNNLIILSNPFPGIRLDSLLTEIPVVSTPLSEKADPCDGCDLCRKLCPAGAIGDHWRDYRMDLCLDYLDRIASDDLSYQICGVCLAACPQSSKATR